MEGVFPDFKMFSLFFRLSFQAFLVTVSCHWFHALFLLVTVKQLGANVTVKIQ